MPELQIARWTKYGHDRIYVTTLEGIDVGYVDLVRRAAVLNDPTFATEFSAIAREWIEENPIDPDQGDPPRGQLPPPGRAEDPPTVLTAGAAGQRRRA